MRLRRSRNRRDVGLAVFSYIMNETPNDEVG